MTKFLTYAVAGLLLALYITVSLYIERGREIAALQGEKSALLGKTSFWRRKLRNEMKRRWTPISDCKRWKMQQRRRRTRAVLIGIALCLMILYLSS